MRERRQIVELYRQGNAIALATLVALEGSSYRRAGARLLIAAEGVYAGAISGGCLEAEVIRKAQWLIRSGATLQRYSTLFDDTADMPYGLGCGGIVHVLLEPAHTPECDALVSAMESSLQGHNYSVLTHFPDKNLPLRRSIFSASGEPVFSSANELDPIASGLDSSASGLDSSASGLDFSASGLAAPNPGPNLPFFEEWLHPPQRLILFGAGDDTQPVAALAALLGWSIVVVDSRASWARPDRFPQAEQVFATNSLEGIVVTPQDAVVLMTHSYEQDRAWLAAVLPCHPRYIGLLGARHRSALLVSEVAARLGWPLDRASANLFAPIGLDLGGDGAESIALAAIAEVQACFEGKLGVSRRMTPETIAEQLLQGGAERYLQTRCAV